jgi:DNA-binding beta-propeller fold protein YncE
MLVLSHPPHHAVRRLDMGDLDMGDFAGMWNCPGYADGQGDEARFYLPYDLATLSNGDLVIADQGNHAIRRITADGTVTTIAGTGHPGMVDGDLDMAQFDSPRALAVDGDMIYVSDLDNHRIRRIDLAAATVQTLAGDGTPGFVDGAGQDARFFGQEGLAVSADGTQLIVADGTQGNVGEPFNRIRAINLP